MSPQTEAWDELKRLAEKHRGLTDPDLAAAVEATLVSKAQSLALSAKAKPVWVSEYPLLAAILAGLKSEAAPVPDPNVEPAAPATPVPNDVELAERLIRDAHIASMRGDKAKAKEILDQAEKAAPTSGAVLMALGDAALERHNVKEAVRLFALAKEAEPTNVVIEKRHADAVFRQTQGMIFDPAAKASGIEAAASAKAATFMSALLPGLGQIVMGEVGKGIVLMAGYLGSWIVAFLIGFDGLFALLGANSKAAPSPMVLVPLALAALFYLIAVSDAAAKSKLAARRPIVRPVPPSDLPFE